MYSHEKSISCKYAIEYFHRCECNSFVKYQLYFTCGDSEKPGAEPMQTLFFSVKIPTGIVLINIQVKCDAHAGVA